jgi:hypothetical protein
MLRAESQRGGAPVREGRRERTGSAGEPQHRPHLLAALARLVRVRQVGLDGRRVPDIVRQPGVTATRWPPPSPEVIGHLVPTLYLAARHLNCPWLAERAERGAWRAAETQLPSGAVRGAVVGQGVSSAVLATGRALLGWLAAFAESGSGVLAGAARRAGRFLLATLDADGLWRRADLEATLSNAPTAWALAEAGQRLGAPEFRAAAARNLRAVTQLSHEDWIEDGGVTNGRRLLLPAMAAAARGVLEGGRVLADERLIGHAARVADRVAAVVQVDGLFTGRWAGGPTAPSTGDLIGAGQMANVWLRLHEITGENRWLEPVAPVLRFLKGHYRSGDGSAAHVGVADSLPPGGAAGACLTQSWATKCFVDALMRDEVCRVPGRNGIAYPLA